MIDCDYIIKMVEKQCSSTCPSICPNLQPSCLEQIMSDIKRKIEPIVKIGVKIEMIKNLMKNGIIRHDRKYPYIRDTEFYNNLFNSDKTELFDVSFGWLYDMLTQLINEFFENDTKIQFIIKESTNKLFIGTLKGSYQFVIDNWPKHSDTNKLFTITIPNIANYQDKLQAKIDELYKEFNNLIHKDSDEE